MQYNYIRFTDEHYFDLCDVNKTTEVNVLILVIGFGLDSRPRSQETNFRPRL